jgi:hypothetical protein
VIRPVSIALLLTLLLPPSIFVAFATPSMTSGMVICASTWVVLGIVIRERPFAFSNSDANWLIAFIFGIAVLTLHVTIIDSQIGHVDFKRFFLSCVLLGLALIGTIYSARLLASVPTVHLEQAAHLILAVLTIIGIAGVAGVQPIGPQASSRSVVIFSEPSHYSLAYLPILLFCVSIAKRTAQLILIGTSLALALALQSLTMVAGLLIVTALLLRPIPLVLMAILVGAGSLALDLSYYASRLAFTSDSTNLSTLVFMQGWENAILNFRETHGFGVGFQQFGIAGSVGDVADRILAILGDPLSLLDGGSTAPKLIGEFGVFGVVGLALFVRMAVRAGLFIRASQLQPVGARDSTRLFFCCFIVTYLVELFVRGTGYFSSGGFLAVVGFIGLAHAGKKHSPEKCRTHGPRLLTRS